MDLIDLYWYIWLCFSASYVPLVNLSPPRVYLNNITSKTYPHSCNDKAVVTNSS